MRTPSHVNIQGNLSVAGTTAELQLPSEASGRFQELEGAQDSMGLSGVVYLKARLGGTYTMAHSILPSSHVIRVMASDRWRRMIQRIAVSSCSSWSLFHLLCRLVT